MIHVMNVMMLLSQTLNKGSFKLCYDGEKVGGIRATHRTRQIVH